MGQYWKAVNLDKKEFLSPHDLGSGAKIREQCATTTIGCALVVLLTAQPEPRGGGDFTMPPLGGDWLIGRWAGDRVAFIGDYAEPGDLKVKRGEPTADVIYSSDAYTNISPMIKGYVDKELAD